MANGLCHEADCTADAAWMGLCTKHYQRKKYGKGKFEQASTMQEYVNARISMVPMSGCAIWVGVVNSSGYGVVCFKGRRVLAHRAAWELHYGKIPRGLQLNHVCDIPSCVNPFHLYLGTQRQNISDMLSRNRADRKGENAHGIVKLSSESVKFIRASTESRSVLAGLFSVSEQTITDVRSRRSWSHI